MYDFVLYVYLYFSPTRDMHLARETNKCQNFIKKMGGKGRYNFWRVSNQVECIILNSQTAGRLSKDNLYNLLYYKGQYERYKIYLVIIKSYFKYLVQLSRQWICQLNSRRSFLLSFANIKPNTFLFIVARCYHWGIQAVISWWVGSHLWFSSVNVCTCSRISRLDSFKQIKACTWSCKVYVQELPHMKLMILFYQAGCKVNWLVDQSLGNLTNTVRHQSHQHACRSKTSLKWNKKISDL